MQKAVKIDISFASKGIRYDLLIQSHNFGTIVNLSRGFFIKSYNVSAEAAVSKLIGGDIKKAYFDIDINSITSTTH